MMLWLLDTLLLQLHETTETTAAAPQTTSPLNNLLNKYCTKGPWEDPDPTIAFINDKLAELADKWFLGYCPQSEFRKLEDKAKWLENVLSLKPLKVNAELYYAIHKDGIETDLPRL